MPENGGSDFWDLILALPSIWGKDFFFSPSVNSLSLTTTQMTE